VCSSDFIPLLVGKNKKRSTPEYAQERLQLVAHYIHICANLQKLDIDYRNLPFLRLAILSKRSTLSRLALDSNLSGADEKFKETDVADLIGQIPNIRDLDLSGFTDTPTLHPSHLLLRDAILRLPLLKTLSLNRVAALDSTWA